jgi:hypothetical protein
MHYQMDFEQIEKGRQQVLPFPSVEQILTCGHQKAAGQVWLLLAIPQSGRIASLP